MESGLLNLCGVSFWYDGDEMKKENFPYEAIAVIAKVLEENSSKYKPSSWRELPITNHVLHAFQHLEVVHFKEQNKTGEDHLAHALCRLAMAIAVRENENVKV